MWWPALLLIPIGVWLGWRSMRTAPQNDAYGSLGYSYLSDLIPLLIDAAAIIAGIAVLMIVFG